MITVYEAGEIEDKHQEVAEPDVLKEPEVMLEADGEPAQEKVAAKKESKSSEKLSPYMNKFLDSLEASIKQSKAFNEPSIKVSELLGKLSRLYEKARNVVEYKGEHVLRRNAIERILKRLVWEQETTFSPKVLKPSGVDTYHIAETLLKELIRARYLPNNSIPIGKVRDVERIIEKYVYLLKHLKNLPVKTSILGAREWVWGIASSEIEDFIDPSKRELYVRLMYEWFLSYFEWQDADIPDGQKNLQIYLAIHRSYPKSDEPIMRFHLLQRKFPDWQNAGKPEVDDFIQRFGVIYQEIEDDLNFKGRYDLYRKIQRHAAAFEIFHSIAAKEESNIRNFLLDENRFEKEVRQVCEENYSQIGKRVNTGIVRSIIYIFITKVLLALILEVPYEVIRFGDVRYIPLSLNIMFPPLAMWIIGFSIKIPGEKNTGAVISRLKSVIYANEAGSKVVFSLARSGTRTTLVRIFSLIYAAIFILVFGGITYLLWLIHFTLLGILIFFAFLSLVLLFAFRVRFNADRLKVEAEEEGLFEHLFSYLSLPFLNFGFYLSKALSKLNFLTIILDFLIEAPIKSIIEIFEEWTSFIRQKKEEVVEVPE